MSQDIRSFFQVLSNKPTTSKKRSIDSSDEDIIDASPAPTPKKTVKMKKRKMVLIDSDSEGEIRPKKNEGECSKPKISNVKKNTVVLKPINVLEAFGNQPVKQTKVETIVKPTSPEKDKHKSNKIKTELGVHDDGNFEKTLLELDEDLLVDNIDMLEKTMEETLKNDLVKTATSTPGNSKSNGKNVVKTPSHKHKKLENEDDGIDKDQERYERRRSSAVLYQKYLNRSGPVHHGCKELPKGKPDCLKNLCFLRTGVLDSLRPDEFDSLIKEHGGRTVHAVSKKVNYIVVGDEPGPAKLEKAHNYGIKTITEDELLDMILIKSGLPTKYVTKEVPGDTKANGTEQVQNQKCDNNDQPNLKKLKGLEMNKISRKEIPKFTKKTKIEHIKIITSKDLEPIEKKHTVVSQSNVSWTEKYKPTDIKGIIGQQGENSNMKKLLTWLRNWYKNHTGKNKPKLLKPSPWAKNDDGAYFKCALLSGPPGVGKTTTATLVARELGFDIVEFNASDTRSKKLLHEEVSQLLSTNSIASYIKDGSAPTNKHVLLMDEVDGMAGNEDRGGMQELILLIKNSNIPIICMCNDRNHTKVRSLANYCLDLRFARPRLEQIKGAMMSVCFKEGLKLNVEALNNLITGAGMDIRQILNHLSMWTANEKTLSSEMTELESNKSKRDSILGPWEVIRKVFSAEEHKNMTLADKSKLFFYDYSIGPLFVQENYLQVVPHCPKEEILERIANTADCISMGDLIDSKIRSTNNWSLLEVEAMYASVLPGFYMSGHIGGQINFPGWLGKNSKRGKFQRLVSELQSHMRTSISASRMAVNLDYIYHLRDGIIRPLVRKGTDGVDESLHIMRSYNLLREDFDSLIELSQWPKQKDPMAMVESRVKAAFTRAYNKDGNKLPYSLSTGVLKKKVSPLPDNEIFGEEEEVDSSPEDEDDITKDGMIKAKKKATTKAKKAVEASTSKKAVNKGKGNKFK